MKCLASLSNILIRSCKSIVDKEGNKKMKQNFWTLKVQNKLIQKGESDGGIGIDVKVQSGAVQYSAVHYISVQCSVVQ